jgi:hypothetical protein
VSSFFPKPCQLGETLPIKYALARIANRRNAAKVRLAKKEQFGSAA